MDNVFFENPPVLHGTEKTQLQQIYGFLYNMSSKLNEAMLAAGVREGETAEADSAAAKVAAEEEKKIRVDITETPEQYIFDVEDNGPAIPAEMQEVIFRKGFTTKKEEGHGMGLAIVRDILAQCKGDINIKSDDEETVFTVRIGKGE